MNKAVVILFFGFALAAQVLSAPQVSVAVNLDTQKITDAAKEVETKVSETAAVAFKQITGEDATKTPDPIISINIGPTTAKPLPVRVRETIQGAIQGAGQAIRTIPSSISAALNNFANGVRNVLAPRPTTPAPSFNLAF